MSKKEYEYLCIAFICTVADVIVDSKLQSVLIPDHKYSNWQLISIPLRVAR